MTTIWKWLGFVFLMALLTSTIAAQESPPSDYVRALSPDGTLMVVASYPSTMADPAEQNIYLMDMSGQVLYPLFPGRYVGSVAWSPDGTEIAMLTVNVAGDRYDLYIVDPETGDTEIQQMSEDTPYLFSLSWSPDGEWLLMQGVRDAFYLLERATGKLTMFAANPLYQSPSWSPNGQFIMFTGRDEKYYGQVFFYDVYKKLLSDNLLQSYRFPKGSGGAVTAVWSPDSQQIAIALAGDANIYLTNIALETFKPFAHTGGQIKSLDWSADGTGIYCL